MKAVKFFALPILTLVLMAITHFGEAHDLANSPTPPPTSDGIALDQGVAYLLMLVALAITYTFH
ncbi:hypothetical protein TanjilG_30736 [Lupinus angustifolius]|uniref:Arabinogalactan peptide 22 n=1 Tax=Lupinus angustifolius TaxID=3871 RepID=A0A1J7GSZ2_LUPAN|nr:hypothetical protein TanjilG_30736 [Lupinus angustifolius]